MNWIVFFAIVIALFLLCGLIIPFGQVLVHVSKWNIWYKWINYIDKNHPQEKQAPSHIHNDFNQKPQ